MTPFVITPGAADGERASHKAANSPAPVRMRRRHPRPRRLQPQKSTVPQPSGPYSFAEYPLDRLWIPSFLALPAIP